MLFYINPRFCSIFLLFGFITCIKENSFETVTNYKGSILTEILTGKYGKNESNLNSPGENFTSQDIGESGDPNNRCGGHIYLGSGLIRSPNFPRAYPNGLDCFWHLYAPHGHIIKLKFLFFNLEFSNTCGNDYLEIRDGATLHSQVLGKFCGFDIPDNLTSTGNAITLHFHTDISMQFQGFEISYEALSPIDDCNCGLHSHSCQRNMNGVKCNCINGYEQKGESCEATCNCGVNSYGCESQGFLNKCYCKSGYVQMGNSCEAECFCGANSYGCAKYWNVVKCFCVSGYVQRGVRCEAECSCGLNSFSCKRYWNVVKCICKNGYVQRGVSCEAASVQRLEIDGETGNSTLVSNHSKFQAKQYMAKQIYSEDMA